MPQQTIKTVPDVHGRFGAYGGYFAPETLMPAILHLAECYQEVREDTAFRQELEVLWRGYAGRPSPLYPAERLSDRVGGARILLKREDLNHTGSHKINNTLGQLLLAKRMGRRRVIAETGAGQHGVATATAAAYFGLECVVYMGAEDVRRQRLNVFRMELLGATVVPVQTGQKTLKDAINAAMRDWMSTSDHTHYVIGSVMGPHPYPLMVRDFQSVIGRETRDQHMRAFGRLPDHVIACVGGGSNAAGMFFPFLNDTGVELIGVEAAGEGVDAPGRHAATLAKGKPGVLHGMRTYVLQDDDGQTMSVHSVSAGLDYPGVGPEHAYWHDVGRVRYVAIDDREAVQAFNELARTEGILPALESAHAVAYAMRLARGLPNNRHVVINLSGRGDKDVEEVGKIMGRWSA